jgi:hypothetical protein
MSIRFETKTPQKLLDTFKKAIDDGHVLTWSYDNDGDFTHTTEQWKNTAWLRPEIVKGESLVMSIIKPTDKKITSEIYAIYHGRFIESMLAHCDTLFDSGVATAMVSDGDIV